MIEQTPSFEWNAPPDPEAEAGVVVIGSSPLMLLQALALARAGQTVTVLDRGPRPGGNWQTVRLPGAGVVEIAAHVIEPIPIVYDALEAASGIPFTVLDRQPIRLHPTGIKVPYSNRPMLLLSGARLTGGWLYWGLRSRIPALADRDAYLNFRAKGRDWWAHQARTVVQKPAMRGPQTGFVDFIERLVRRCRDQGVRICRFDVVRMERKAGWWHLTSAEAEVIEARAVHVTTSANLKREGLGGFTTQPLDMARRKAQIVSISRPEVSENHTYVAFWRDPLILRIARIDRPDGAEDDSLRFLIEFREDRTPPRETVTEALEKSGILAKGRPFEKLGDVDCAHVRNSDQLPVGLIAEDVHGLYSLGNLAAGVAGWLKEH